MDAKWIVFATLVAVSTTAAYGATTQRTFVASSGNDINPCSIVQPCRSFGAAIGRTLAGGEVIVLDSAGYGVVTITKSVSIITPPGVYAGVSVPAGQTGITVNGSGIIVVLRGLTINGTGGSVGVHFTNSGSRLRIENCIVSGVTSTGILMDAAASELVATDTTVRDNGGAGVKIAADASVVLESVRIEHNIGDGIFVVAATTLAHATVRRSVLSHNVGSGVIATMGPLPARTELVIEDSVVVNNGQDGITVGGIGTGYVAAQIGRNSIAANGLSGVSAFTVDTVSAGSWADVVENTFGDAPISCVTAGGSARIYLSRNHYGVGAGTVHYSTNITGGALGYTYKNNSGISNTTGTVSPLAVDTF